MLSGSSAQTLAAPAPQNPLVQHRGLLPLSQGQGLLHHSQTEGFVKASNKLQRRIETPVFLLDGIKDVGTIDPHAADHELIASWTQKLISLCSAVLHN